MRVRVRILLVSTMLAGALCGGAFARPQAASELAPAERTAALARIKAEVDAHYVFPERRAAILDRLDEGARLGRYDVADPDVFAERVSEDLLASSRDTHLYLRFEPDWFAAADEPASGEDGVQNAIEAMIARHTNHGLTEMRILPGNIRYLRVEGFSWLEDETGPAYDAAMLFLRGGRAVILDLRGNGGGWIEASRYLISHFLPSNTLIATFWTPDQEPEQYRTADYLASGRIQGVPIYVLIDGRSRSAAEMVAYTFQQYELGELIGARTQGAANVSDDFAVAPGFRLSVSTGRTVQPISRTDWEGVGVAPTVEADPSRALAIAQMRAIDRLLPDTPDGVPRHQLAWARPALEASLDPVTLDAGALRRFAGDYGAVSVRFREGLLWLHRPGRAPTPLRAMTSDGLFQATGDDGLRVRIAPEGLDLLRPNPAANEHHRVRPTSGR